MALMREIMRRASRIVSQRRRRRPARAANRRQDRPLPRALQRPARRRDLGSGARVCWRRNGTGHSEKRRRHDDGEEERPLRQGSDVVGDRSGQGHKDAGYPRLYLSASRLVEGKEHDLSATERVAGRRGVSREIKRRVLRDLEAAGLITVERPSRKSPIVTLVVL